MGLFIYFICYYLIIFIVKSFVQYKRTGKLPIHFNGDHTGQQFIGLLFGFISFVILIITGMHAFYPSFIDYLLPFSGIDMGWLKILGWLFLIDSVGIVIIAQYYMADSWQIGIDTENQPELKTEGIFSISRNPVFLGILIGNLGLFLILPNAATLIIFITNLIIINIQIRHEESHLEQSVGQRYLNYKNNVRRWL